MEQLACLLAYPLELGPPPRSLRAEPLATRALWLLSCGCIPSHSFYGNPRSKRSTSEGQKNAREAWSTRMIAGDKHEKRCICRKARLRARSTLRATAVTATTREPQYEEQQHYVHAPPRRMEAAKRQNRVVGDRVAGDRVAGNTDLCKHLVLLVLLHFSCPRCAACCALSLSLFIVSLVCW